MTETTTEEQKPAVEMKPELKGRIDSLFGGIFAGRNGAAPALDIEELDDAYLIKADLPGVKREDIDLRCDGDRLELDATRRSERVSGSNGGSHQTERSFGHLRRVVRLPGLESEGATAKLADGVLTVEIPRRPSSEGSIEISE